MNRTRSTITALMIAQICAGFGHGLTFSMGSLLAVKLQGEAWGGTALALTMAGAAIWAIPLGKLVTRFDRRASLMTGLILAMVGASSALLAAQTSFFPLALFGFFFLGGEVAVNYQARFAASDVSAPGHQARNLSIVMWSTTVGAIIGPQLFSATERLRMYLGLEEFTGAYIICLVAQALGVIALFVGMPRGVKPAAAQEGTSATTTTEAGPAAPAARLRDYPAVRAAIATVAVSHFAMISIMAMSAVHLRHNHADLSFIGIVISGHIGAMYILAPLFGFLADRYSALTAIGLGVGLNIASCIIIFLSGGTSNGVLVGMVVLGFGWSSTLVGTSSLLLAASPQGSRAAFQSRSDLVMNLTGAAGGLLAGPVAALIGLQHLAGVIAVIIAVQVLACVRALRERPSAAKQNTAPVPQPAALVS